MARFQSLEDLETLRRFVGNLREGVYIRNAQGRILDANAAFLAMLGVSSVDDLRRLSAYDVLVDPALRAQELEQLSREGAVRDFELQIRRSDGQIRTVLDTCTAVRDGEETRFLGILVDITERKRAEQSLEAYVALQRATLESTADGIVMVDGHGKVLSYNTKFAQMWRIPEEVLASGDSERAIAFVLDQLKDPERFVARIRELDANPEASGYDVVEFKDGRVFERYSHPQLAGGLSVGRVSSYRDVTERTRREEDLKKSRERFELVTRATNDAMWEWDAVTGEGWWNEGVQTLFGYAAEEVRTDSEWWRGRVHSEDVERIESGVLAVIKGNGHYWSDEYRFRRADGSYAHVLDRAYVARDAAGSAVRVMGAIIDITERKRAEAALRASERRYRTLVEEMNEGLIVTDIREVIEFVNNRMCSLLGYSPEEMVGRTTLEFMAGDEDRGIVLSKAQLREDGISDRYELAFRQKPGGTVWTLVSGTPLIDAGGAVIGTIGIVTDITERKRAEDALRQSEERYALAAAGANDGLWDWDLTTKEVYYASRWKAMLGYDDAAIGTSLEEWFSRVHPDDLEWLKVALEGHVAGATAHFESAHRIRHRDGTFRWMLTRGLAVRDATGRAYRMAGSQTDITERKVTEQQLMHDAFHDALTGLPNRALFMDELVHSVHRAKRRKDYAFAVLFLDVDRFKLVNDSLGHGAGDQLLVALARRLQEAVRPGDRVARLGGDEFAVLLDDVTDGSDATRVADRIQKGLAAPLDLAGREVFSTASIGIALSATGYDRAEDALRDADLASYRAKAQGRDRYEVFDLGMHARAVARLELETDLRRALERREFWLDYQPIVALQSGDLVGFEALLRWRRPRRGLASPGEFVPVAEETGLIVPIGRWVLREACRQLCEWRRAFPDRSALGVSVNVSFKQLLHADLPQHVEQVLAEAELEARRLHLEITENVIMEHAEAVASVLALLKDLNVRLHMDDFGTGYSSLSNLRRFPVDALKIDRLFVGRMEEAENLEIVRTIIVLAHHLGLQVIAEGVETATQAAQLRALECEYGQGFLFSPPVGADAAAALLANRSAVAH